MNKQRRKELQELSTKAAALYSELEDLLTEEQNYMNNMPTALVGSTRWEVAEEATTAMENALDELTDAIESIDAAVEA